MSSKIGTLLSLIFVAMFVALGADMMSIQYLYSNLDTKSSAISYEISKRGIVDDVMVSTIKNKYNVEFQCLDNCTSNTPGSVIKYRIKTTYKPIIISKQSIDISVTRHAVLSYYD